MQGFNAFLTTLTVALAIAVAGLAHALVQCPPYCVSAAAETSTGIHTAGSDDSCGKCQAQTQQGEAEGKEFWLLFGYKLKITDTLLVAFTLLLALATGALWWATGKLVEGAEKTAEKQLRAYICTATTNIAFKEGKWKLSYSIKNFGKTPAYDVTLKSRSEVVDWNTKKPLISAADKIEKMGSMGPNGDTFENESEVQGTATVEELQKTTKAIFLVGTIAYATVFGGNERNTQFRYYIGGDVGYQEGKMSADSTGNDST
jgi:hypothetical protein